VLLKTASIIAQPRLIRKNYFKIFLPCTCGSLHFGCGDAGWGTQVWLAAPAPEW